MKHFLLAALLSVSATAALATPVTDLSPMTAPAPQADGAVETAWIQPYLPPLMRRAGGNLSCGAICCGPICVRR